MEGSAGPMASRFLSNLGALNPIFSRSGRGRILGISPFYLLPNRTHPTINPRHFSVDLASSFPTNRFKASHLEDTVVSLSKTNWFINLTPSQFETLQGEIPDCGGGSRRIKRMLLVWFDVLNAGFFGGGLGLLRDNINVESNMDEEGRGGMEGLTMHMPGMRGVMYINKTPDLPDTFSDRIECFYIATLLHEMTHAFLNTYYCECQSCRRKRDSYTHGFGKYGHGPNWASTCTAVAQALQNVVPWEVDAGIHAGVEGDMERAHWRPTSEQMRSWEVERGYYDHDFVGNMMEQARLYRERETQVEQQEEARRQGTTAAANRAREAEAARGSGSSRVARSASNPESQHRRRRGGGLFGTSETPEERERRRRARDAGNTAANRQRDEERAREQERSGHRRHGGGHRHHRPRTPPTGIRRTRSHGVSAGERRRRGQQSANDRALAEQLASSGWLR